MLQMKGTGPITSASALMMLTMVNQLLTTKRNTKDPLNGSGQSQKLGTGDKTISSSYGLRSTQEIPALNMNRPNFSASSIISSSQQNLNHSFSLSQYLYSVMPKNSVTLMIFTQANYLQMPFQMFCRLRNTTNAEDCDGQSPLVRASRKPPPTSHPVIFAQKLYKIALCMLELEPTTIYETKNGLKEPVRDASKRLVEVAMKHVTSQDTLMDNLDGIETLLLESGYYLRIGNHYAAWLTIRRAIGLAELMGLRRTKTGDDGAELLWYLLNYSDRFVSALFGLPCNSSDNSFASKRVLAGKSVVEMLGRIQVALLGRIIDRNMKMQCCNKIDCSTNEFHAIYEQTRGIDCDLKKSAKILPVDPWVMPNSSSSAADKDVSKRTRILQVQMHHYYMLLLLHQPYLLQKSCLPSERMHNPVDYQYSKMATLSASRDLLDRYLILRDIHHTIGYGGLDHKAWLASASLLLAHIDTHQLPPGDTLEYQRLQDIAMIHRLIDRFRKAPYRAESVQQICTLLEIEANAANGERYYFMWSVNSESMKAEGLVQLSIPYFGTISVLSTKLEMSRLPCVATDFLNTETRLFEVTAYAGFGDTYFPDPHQPVRAGHSSGSMLPTKTQEDPPEIDNNLLINRTEYYNIASESVQQVLLALDNGSDIFLSSNWTETDM
jgi:hypothetical protein